MSREKNCYTEDKAPRVDLILRGKQEELPDVRTYAILVQGVFTFRSLGSLELSRVLRPRNRPADFMGKLLKRAFAATGEIGGFMHWSDHAERH